MFGIYVVLVIGILLAIKFCKKTLKTVLISILGISLLYTIMLGKDIQNVNNLQKPIFVVEKSHDDLSKQTTSYIGLGYEVKIVKDLTTGETLKSEMHMFNKCIAGAIQ